MPNRLRCSLNSSEIVKRCKYKNKANELQEPKWLELGDFLYKQKDNVRPNEVVPVLTNATHFLPTTKDYPDYCLVSMKWGLAPYYLDKSDTLGYNCQDTAELEFVHQTPSYSSCLLKDYRCIILADGYYEFQTTYNQEKRYFLHQKKPKKSLKDPHLMKFAGLFKIENFCLSYKFYCTILTRPADESLSWLDKRMPIILNTDEDVNSWLNYKDVNYKEALTKLPIYKRFHKKFELHHSIVEKPYLDSVNPGMKRKAESRLDAWTSEKK